MYRVYNKVNRGNLGSFKMFPLRHFRWGTESSNSSRWKLKALRVQWQNLMRRFASLPERGNENIKYIIRSDGIPSRTLVPLRSYGPFTLYFLFAAFG